MRDLYRIRISIFIFFFLSLLLAGMQQFTFKMVVTKVYRNNVSRKKINYALKKILTPRMVSNSKE